MKDIARLVELCSHTERSDVVQASQGKIIEAGGPESEFTWFGQRTLLMRLVFTYKQIMGLVLKYSNRRRPIISVPFWAGRLQGTVMDYLPESIFSISRDQVSSTLRYYSKTLNPLEGISARVGQYCHRGAESGFSATP